MHNDDGDFDYYAHEADISSLGEDGRDVWQWASSFTSATDTNISTNRRHAEYMDQILPFNITLIAQNEYGYAAWKAILGIEIKQGLAA